MIQEYADYKGMSRSAVENWIKKGMPTRNRYFIDPGTADEWYEQNLGGCVRRRVVTNETNSTQRNLQELIARINSMLPKAA